MASNISGQYAPQQEMWSKLLNDKNLENRLREQASGRKKNNLWSFVDGVFIGGIIFLGGKYLINEYYQANKLDNQKIEYQMPNK